MIEFILNNTQIRTEEKSGMTLLHFIREIQGLKGTKSGCKEGDCGACTVLIGTLQNNNSVAYKSITSCLAPLASVQGKHVVSVEGVNLKNELNVAQQAISNNYATQCGFCTPGFVNSLTGLALRRKKVSEADGVDVLSGNICRCTGYKSLEKAAKDVSNQLEKIDSSDQLTWLVQHKFIPDYFRDIPAKLKELTIYKNETNAVLVGGGTDLYVRYADNLLEQDIQVANEFVPNTISFKDHTCTIGANATVSDLLESKKLNDYFPRLKGFLKLVSSEQIRNMASIGGNFVPEKLDYVSTLCAASVPQDKIQPFTEVVNQYPGVTHNYQRDNRFNVWFTFIAHSREDIKTNLQRIASETGIQEILNLPATRVFKIKAHFTL